MEKLYNALLPARRVITVVPPQGFTETRPCSTKKSKILNHPIFFQSLLFNSSVRKDTHTCKHAVTSALDLEPRYIIFAISASLPLTLVQALNSFAASVCCMGMITNITGRTRHHLLVNNGQPLSTAIPQDYSPKSPAPQATIT